MGYMSAQGAYSYYAPRVNGAKGAFYQKLDMRAARLGLGELLAQQQV